MRLHLECMRCNVNQVLRIGEMLNIPLPTQETIMRKVLKNLSEADFSRPNTILSRKNWQVIIEHLQNNDPYKETKSFFNQALLAEYETIKKHVAASQDPLKTALKAAIAGNLIDFSPGHAFDIQEILAKLAEIEHDDFPIDDSDDLFDQLTHAQTLLYLGDNCGEIVLDKLFIEYLHQAFPQLHILYGVRGQPIMNDITRVDAQEVGMEEVATVIDNGMMAMGTLLDEANDAFQQQFAQADVIIAKGQGNFESLSDAEHDHLYFLFMAKCKPVASLIDVPQMSIVCLKKK